MQFQARADVYTANGEKAGALERVVIDPRNRQVTHLIVQKGLLFHTDKVVPVSMVAEANKDRVVLNPDAGTPDNLPDFSEDHYVPVDDAEWAHTPAGGPVGAPMLPGAATAPLLLWYPTIAGVTAGGHVASELGAGPAAGVAAATQQQRQVEVERNIPEDTVPLKEGARVVAADGEHVGDVERVFTDTETSEVTHLLISQGLFLKEHKVIPMVWVLDVAEDEVRLAVGSNLLQGLRSYEG